MGQRLIVTIDGPAGVGKSTLGRNLAQALSYRYVDSGALYRAVAWQALALGLNPADQEGLSPMLAAFRPEVEAGTGCFQVCVAGQDITPELRTPEVTQASSRVATLPQVRRFVGELLKKLSRNGGVVAEGRDLGSAVFPEADVKFYLDADLDTRAARRQRECQDDSKAPGLAGTTQDMAERDRRDQNRRIAPLTIPAGAYHIDTTKLDPDEVLALCLVRIRESVTAAAADI